MGGGGIKLTVNLGQAAPAAMHSKSHLNKVYKFFNISSAPRVSLKLDSISKCTKDRKVNRRLTFEKIIKELLTLDS